MKTILALAALVLALTACGDDGGPTTAADRAGGGAAGGGATAPRPAATPAAAGPVRSRSLATVMDTGAGAELCLGPVAESYPPQCGGPTISNWDWSKQRGTFDEQGDVRWGTYAVTGTWDGTAFTVTEAVPGALYDPAPPEQAPLPEPSRDYSQPEAEALATDLGSWLPGAQGAYADGEGHVLVDVVYDDGTLQRYVDEAHGVGVVVVTGALVDA
ncbi:hypothetical protein [Nocardioides sp. 1609]|uniref:hypothetical protein n=1 Tax=Nocardioides sp. 1609 TaxID=2508327 RepID=UPI00106FDFB2|nr:hypothetical protein [Nocardioides sp. 1609]